MRLKYLFSMALVGAISFSTISCKTEGCTDPDSETFSADADIDDGSCQYEGQVVFWYGKATSDSLEENVSSALSYYIDGKVKGSTASSVYWTGTSGPDCGQDGSITITEDLGDAKLVSRTYKVEDEWGDELWSGNVEFSANTCLAVELTW